ncbi:MAG: SRPBCC family protein, partial [Hyphomicrobiaceae bacterium]
ARPARVAADDRRRRLRAPVIKVTAARVQERDGHTALSQRFVLEHPQAAVWDLLGDIPRLARCMPGVSLDGPPEAGRVSGFLDVKLGPITARFAGQGEVNLRPAEQRLRLEGRGVDRKGGSNVSGSVDCRLEPTTGAGGAVATAVHLDLAYALSGPLAQIARGGLVHDLARRLAQMFAQNMDAQLRHADAAPSVAALSGLALLLQITRDRLARWLRTLLGRPT